ncbi:MAG TPA: biotin/lipoyl-containing protein, partial [Burkholderiales bacterium]
MSQVVVPDIGDFEEVEVIEVLVKPGDAVSKEQSLITLESDKATMEIPSPSAGVVKEIKIKMGDKVSKGSPILVLEDGARGEAPKAAAPQPAEVKKVGPGTAQTVAVPDIGDFKEVEVIEVLVKPGDAVDKEQSLVTLESDKATMEIPSPGAGVVQELKLKVGDKVSKGSPILVLAASSPSAPQAETAAPQAETAKPAKSAPPAPPPPAVSTRPVPREPREATASKPHASPSVRKFARELGVDLARVQASGPKGRVLHADVQGFVKGALSGKAAPVEKTGGALPFNLPAWPEVDFAKFGPIESKPLSRIQKLSGPYLHRNWVSIPHVTQFDEADITDLEAFRKAQTAETEKKGFKLTLLAFLIKACVTALKQYPQFNASLDKSGENVIFKKYYHI